MLNKNKYWKSLLGSNAEILISKQVEYTAIADYPTFVNTAVDGEFGFFAVGTGLLVSSLAAVATGTEIFAAVKRGAVVETSLKFTTGSYKKSVAAYAAAVAQVSTVTYTGNPVAGKEYGVRVIETTPGFQQFPTWSYSVVAKSGETLTQLVARLVTVINDAANLVNKDTDPLVTASSAAGVLTLTAKIKGSSFRVAFPYPASIDDLAAAVVYTTAPSYGSGNPVQITELEKYADVLKGVTTNYPGNDMANPEDYGKPDSAVVSGGQYSITLLRGEKTEASPTPVEKHFAEHVIVLVTPSNGAANPTAEIATILG